MSGEEATPGEAGADLNAETPLHWAAGNDGAELVDAPGSIIGGLGPTRIS